MATFYIYYWTIGASGASCGLAPINVRAKVKAEDAQKAKQRLFARHPSLDEGNIIKIERVD